MALKNAFAEKILPDSRKLSISNDLSTIAPNGFLSFSSKKVRLLFHKNVFSLFIVQCLDRVEPRSFYRWIIAEKYPGYAANSKRNNNGGY